MSRTLKVAAIQATLSQDMQANIDKVSNLIREAAAKGAEIILPSELFCDHYFCKVQDEKFFATAYPWAEHPAVVQLGDLARELGVVIPVSIYEKDGPEYYNSIVIIDADGTPLGVYRKSHIPDGPGYMEKFYFRPGNTGFRVWETMKGTIGVGICWDQWFPEAARAMTLMGADILFYPTAIGSEPHDDSLDTAARWRRAMQGHAVANVIPVVAANRTGDEEGQIFYGTSFIADHAGEIVADLGRDEEGVITAEFDLEFLNRHRAAWGFFRDRRTDLYEVLG
ncbi:MAG: N-carbamoylputrescine amidase [Pseudomonadota bacterium]|nr:N-carbamoylputrescine amidase [Pseudomonadota bacterium]